MRNRIKLGESKEIVKLLTVTGEGVLIKHVQPPIPTRIHKNKPRLHTLAPKGFWDFDKAIADKVRKFKEGQKKLIDKLDELVKKDNKRAMGNIDKWFDSSLKVAV